MLQFRNYRKAGVKTDSEHKGFSMAQGKDNDDWNHDVDMQLERSAWIWEIFWKQNQ